MTVFFVRNRLVCYECSTEVSNKPY